MSDPDRTDERLMCCPHRLTYDWNTRIGRLAIEDEDCTDQGGCVGFFHRLQPQGRRRMDRCLHNRQLSRKEQIQ